MDFKLTVPHIWSLNLLSCKDKRFVVMSKWSIWFKAGCWFYSGTHWCQEEQLGSPSTTLAGTSMRPVLCWLSLKNKKICWSIILCIHSNMKICSCQEINGFMYMIVTFFSLCVLSLGFVFSLWLYFFTLVVFFSLWLCFIFHFWFSSAILLQVMLDLKAGPELFYFFYCFLLPCRIYLEKNLFNVTLKK